MTWGFSVKALSLECEKIENIHINQFLPVFAKKDKITKLQNALDPPPSVQFYLACQQNPL